jgi:hypothetical protein
LAILILSTHLLNVNNLHSQTFDFYKKDFISGDKNRVSNESFTFTLKNVNTFKYKIEINSTLINNNTNIPDFYKNNMLKDTLQLDTIFKSGEKLFNKLMDKYSKLKTCEQFYIILNDLVLSDLMPDSIIKYKRRYYEKYIEGLNNQYTDDNTATAEIFKYYSKLILEIQTIGKLMNSNTLIENQKALIESILSYVKKLEENNIIHKLANLYLMINEQTFTVSTFIPRPDADELIINISAVPIDNDNETKELKINIPFNVKGGFKVDFSTGIFATNLVDDDYLNQPQFKDDTLQGYKLIKSDEFPLGVGFSAFMHGYFRSGRNINIGPILGLGIDQYSKLKYMPGVSIMLGNKERFIFNGGLALGKVKRLSLNQSIDCLYIQKVEKIDYSELFKIGWFVGISYNLNSEK